jgi:hypothetical protein
LKRVEDLVVVLAEEVVQVAGLVAELVEAADLGVEQVEAGALVAEPVEAADLGVVLEVAAG